MPLKIEEIPVNKTNMSIPEDGIRMFFMQPFVELTPTEPFKWQSSKKQLQIDRIARFFNIARDSVSNGERPHFTIIPEYSIPGLKGVNKIHEILSDSLWPSETIIIGGVDGLNKAEYALLCSDEMTFVCADNSPDKIPDGKWVNCCIIWIKNRMGKIKRWVQLKLSPAWAERNITNKYMFSGQSIFLFTIKFNNQSDCNFFPLICFDWIGALNSSGMNGIWCVLHTINEICKSASINKLIDFIFIIQCNDEPYHRNFLENARDYFENRAINIFIDRDKSILVFVNTSGLDRIGKHDKYGQSALISSFLSPYDNVNCCPPSFASMTTKLRGGDVLGRCKEALFRESGSCIHYLRIRSSRFISLGPSDRCLCLEEAKVYAIDDGFDDPRVPGGPVAASIKWVNDEIDSIEPILSHENRSHIKGNVAGSHENLSRDIRRASGDFLCEYIRCSFSKYKNFCQNSNSIIHFVDKWSEEEKEGLQTVIHTLSIIGTCKSINVSSAVAHAIMTVGSNIIDIIVVHGGNTHEECFEYAKGFLTSQSRYGIVVTKDIHDTSTDTKINRSILNTQEPITERGPNITNPDNRFIHRGYQNIKTCCFSATSVDNLKEQIDLLLGV